MKETIFPVMVTTRTALRNCIKENVKIIHISNELYCRAFSPVPKIMAKHGYSLENIPTKNGVFYTKDIDIDQYSIYDPCHLY